MYRTKILGFVLHLLSIYEHMHLVLKFVRYVRIANF